MSKAEQMAALRQECAGCQKCALADTRTNLVFGDGNPDSPIMLIGEGPGEQEDLSGIPFVGRGGQLLDQMLDIIDLDRSQYYICNRTHASPGCAARSSWCGPKSSSAWAGLPPAG